MPDQPEYAAEVAALLGPHIAQILQQRDQIVQATPTQMTATPVTMPNGQVVVLPPGMAQQIPPAPKQGTMPKQSGHAVEGLSMPGPGAEHPMQAKAQSYVNDLLARVTKQNATASTPGEISSTSDLGGQ